MRFSKENLLLYAVTDRKWVGKQTLQEQIEESFKGGVTLLQVREKDLPKESFIKEALEIKKLCEKYGVPLIINDDVEVALKVDADGVHVGQSDMIASNVRKLIGKDKILGVSAATVEEAKSAEEMGADYLGVGAAFGTSTKKDAKAIDHKIFKEISSAVSIPVVAIGGINKENIKELKGTGIDGVALVSAIFGVEGSIEEECRCLKKKVEEMLKL